MRLMQLMAGARHGGAEAFFERLAIGLQQAGVAQRLVIRRDAERAALLRAAGCEVIELPFGGMFDFKTRPPLRRAIDEFKPHVVLSWMNRATKFCSPGFAALRRGKRGNFAHAARLGGYYDLKYYRRCDHLIGNTRGIVDYIRAGGWPPDRVHYLPNFVTVPEAEPVSRASLATPEGVPLLFALGRLHPNKGFDVLIDALAQIPYAHLWLAGEGPEFNALEAQAKRLDVDDRVHFLGWRDDIASLFAAADIFVCSSRIEPLGNVVIEAWAASKPVVSTAAAGPRELVEEGETGLLAPVDDADAVAESIKRLISSPGLRAHLTNFGREAYEKEFSEERVIGLYQEFFDKVAR